jgi:hypothetical protein
MKRPSEARLRPEGRPKAPEVAEFNCISNARVRAREANTFDQKKKALRVDRT